MIDFIWPTALDKINQTLCYTQRILHEWSFHMKFIKRAVGMTTSVRFCLSYDPLKKGLYHFQKKHYYIKKTHCWHGRCQWHYAFAPKCYYTCGHMIFMTRCYPLNNRKVTWYSQLLISQSQTSSKTTNISKYIFCSRKMCPNSSLPLIIHLKIPWLFPDILKFSIPSDRSK